MRYAAFDLGRNIGFARAVGAGKPTFGTYKLPAPTSLRGSYFSCFRIWLEHQWQYMGKPDQVIYAKPIMMPTGHAAAAMQLLGLAAHLEQLCDAYQIEALDVWESTARSQFLSPDPIPRVSQAIKSAIMERCESLGWQVETNHEADALVMLEYARAQSVPGWRGAAERSGLFSLA